MVEISSIEEARKLKAPVPVKTHAGMDDGKEFWEQYDSLLKEAWGEFGLGDKSLQQFE